MRYVLEPMLFAFEQDMAKEQLVDYLEELRTLDNWWDIHREDMFIQNTTNDILWANNYYPMANSLKWQKVTRRNMTFQSSMMPLK